MPVFNVRIESLPPEQSGSLRDLREVIEKMYADFHVGLPDCDPPIIYSLATMEDGRTRESRYPSLMSFETRDTFGI